MALPTKSTLQWSCVPQLDPTKTTMIFLPAALLSSNMFEETVIHLSSLLPTANLLRIDLNSFGKTASNEKGSTLWTKADDIIALMNELQIASAILVGASLGGSLALYTALSHSTRITALVLLSTTASEGAPQNMDTAHQFRDAWVATPSPSEQIMDMAMRSWGGDPDVHGRRAQRIKRDWVERSWGARQIDDMLAMVQSRESVLGRLREVVVPVLVVHGDGDTVYPVEQAVGIQKGLVNAKVSFEVIKGAGHLLVWIRDSEDVSRMIADFVIKEVLNNE